MHANNLGQTPNVDAFGALRNILRCSDASVEKLLTSALAARAAELGSNDITPEELDTFTKSILSCYSLRYTQNHVANIRNEAVAEYLVISRKSAPPYLMTAIVAIVMFYAASAVDKLPIESLTRSIFPSTALSAPLTPGASPFLAMPTRGDSD